MKFIKFYQLTIIILFSLYGVASNAAFLDFENTSVGIVGICDGTPGDVGTTCTYQSSGFTFTFLADFYIDDGAIFPTINNNTQFFIPTYIPELKRGTPEVHPLIISFNPSNEISLDLYLINSAAPVRVEALDDQENILDFIETSTDGRVTFSGLSTSIHKLYLGTIGTTIVAGFAIDNIETTPTINDIINFILAHNDIHGEGPGNSADHRYDAFLNMLLVTADLIEAGDNEGTCGQLNSIIKKCDGLTKPPDFINGNTDTMGTLMVMLDELATSLVCE